MPVPLPPADSAALLTWARDLSAFLSERFLAIDLSLGSGTVTLTPNVATMTIQHPMCRPGTRIILFPTTANAAAELGAGTIYTSSKGTGSFVLTHANNAQADRTFDYHLFARSSLS